MYLPKYLKCFENVTNPYITFILDVSALGIFFVLTCASLFINFFSWRARVELVRSVSGNVRATKKPVGGNNMNSVFKRFFPMPICISRPNRAKWWERRVIPFSMSVLDSKKNAP